MRKQPIGLDDIPPARTSRRLPRIVLAFMLAVAILPIAYESALLCVGNWKAAFGMTSEVHTPVLDSSRYYLERLRDDLVGLVAPWFQHVPWQPSYVLLAAGAAMTLSMLMLKR